MQKHQALEIDFPDADKVLLVNDNYNTHSLGAFYDKFERERARRLCRRLEIIPTPKHGSWLNIAESGLSVSTRMCVKDRRFGTTQALQTAVEA
ncbi:MAG: transposase [Planctomycetaceae bacterium]|jgi:hypothetical protein|nr:transposase [Planctomycetaceae bacterium]